MAGKSMTLVACLKDYFGMHKDTTSVDFLKEVRALNEQHRNDFREMLKTVGYEPTN